MLLVYLLLLTVIVVSFLISNLFRLKNKYSGSDCFFHYTAAEQIKKNKYKSYDHIDTYTLPNPPDYPPIILYVLALLPSDKVVSYGRFFGSLIDIFNKLLVFFTTKAITKDPILALLSVAVYSLVNTTSIDQAEGSARPLGVFFYNVLLLFLYLYHTTQSFIHILLSMIVIYLGYLSLKFFSQVTIATLFFLAVYYKDPAYVAPIFLAAFLLWLTIRKRFILILKDLISVWKIWFSMRNVPHPGKRGYSKWLVFVYYFLSVNIIDLFLMFSIVFFRFTVPKELIFFFSLVVFIRIFAFFVYTAKHMRCIGEAYRYYAYSAMPAAICLSYLLYNNRTNAFLMIMMTGVAFISILLLLLWQTRYKRNKFYFSTPSMIQSLENIKRFNIKNMLVIPFQYSRNVAFLTKKKTFLTLSQCYFYRIKSYTWGIGDFNKELRKDRISHVLMHNDHLSRYNIKNARVIYKDTEFTLYKMKMQN